MSSSPDMTPEEGFNRTALQAAKESGSSQEGKWFLVTGAYSGIGVETTKALLEVGGSVIVGGRNLTALETFVQELQEKYGEDRIYGYGLDLADLSSAKRFCDDVLASCNSNSKENNNNKTIIDVVILNAGVMATPCGTTKDGFEMQIGTNVIGHFLVAKLLAPIRNVKFGYQVQHIQGMMDNDLILNNARILMSLQTQSRMIHFIGTNNQKSVIRCWQKNFRNDIHQSRRYRSIQVSLKPI